MEKDVCREESYTELFCANIPTLFYYILPFYHPYISLHFDVFCRHWSAESWCWRHRYICGCVCVSVYTYIREYVSGTYHSQCASMSNRSREHYHSYYIHQYKHSTEMALRNDYEFCWWIIITLTRREYIIRTVNSKPEKWKGSPSALQTVVVKPNTCNNSNRH